MELTFRPATAADSDFIADTILGANQESTRAALAVFGVVPPDRLRRLFRDTRRRIETWRHTEIVMAGDRPIGVLQVGEVPTRITAGLVLSAIRAAGIHVGQLVARLRIAERVSPTKPPDALVIAEIHVLAEFRGRGVGSALLGRAETRAREQGASCLALHTLVTNPARRLYERLGYVASGEATDPDFERLTGVRGNVLYVKDLGAPATLDDAPP